MGAVSCFPSRGLVRGAQVSRDVISPRRTMRHSQVPMVGECIECGAWRTNVSRLLVNPLVRVLSDLDVRGIAVVVLCGRCSSSSRHDDDAGVLSGWNSSSQTLPFYPDLNKIT